MAALVGTVVITLTSMSMESLQRVRDSLAQCEPDLIWTGLPTHEPRQFGRPSRELVWRLHGSLEVRATAR